VEKQAHVQGRQYLGLIGKRFDWCSAGVLKGDSAERRSPDLDRCASE
jgi:hypothetical protein